ncbi:exonuclease domain-containing protein [Compostibacter hankyongensis]|uniref:Excinuclease cho n=1 Tax=Compostibacter hankyongensis TaxID=1007089 RepID=A0ABP8G7T0_9BACT
MYAVVDIETTGGNATAAGITEVAVVLHDGARVVRTWETLVNPRQPVPPYIQALTGITPALLADAPVFEAIAAELFGLLKGNIFVAHNVNFDYSFLKHQLAKSGFTLEAPKLCTVRLSRKVWPGLPSYSLGRLCRQLGVALEHRHRAGGDAAATAELLTLLIRDDREGHLQQHLKKNSPERFLPMHLPEEQLETLPQSPGVYYFHDRQDKVIYVGKARNLSRRVRSHFANNNPGRQRQEFLRRIHRISFEVCATELAALVRESVEIRQRWPEYNRAQKRPEQVFGLYAFEDQQGYLRLAIEKRRRQLQPLETFSLLIEGQTCLRRLVREFGLCTRLCFLQRRSGACTAVAEGSCRGACTGLEAPHDYNRRVEAAMASLRQEQPSFVIALPGPGAGKQSCMLVERGLFYGMGEVEAGSFPEAIEDWKARLTPYPGNDYIRQLLLRYAQAHPAEVRMLGALPPAS